MVRIKKWTFFFGPKNPDFGPKIRFFVWDPVFCQRGVRNPRRWLRFGTNVSSLRLFVPELRPFSWGEPGRRSKKSSPTPLWGHRLPVTALARWLDKNHCFHIILSRPKDYFLDTICGQITSAPSLWNKQYQSSAIFNWLFHFKSGPICLIKLMNINNQMPNNRINIARIAKLP